MIVYSVFDTTYTDNYKHMMSSNNIDDVYNKIKSLLQIDLDYEQFKAQYKNKITGQIVYESDEDLKSVMVVITPIERK